jgi:DNA polymerase elongation subunit (family B)
MKIYVREISASCSTPAFDKWSKTSILFGNFPGGESVALIVHDFMPSIYVLPILDTEEFNLGFAVDAKEDLNKRCNNIIHDARIVPMAQLVGFTNNTMHAVLELVCSTVSGLWKLKNELKESGAINGTSVFVVNPKISVDAQFSYKTNISPGTWIEIAGSSRNYKRVTSCSHEFRVSIRGIRPMIDAPVPHPPLKVTIIRTRAFSASATKVNIYKPQASNKGDRLRLVSLLTYHMSNPDEITVEHLQNGDESTLLINVSARLRALDPDVLMQCSDDTNDIFYLFERLEQMGYLARSGLTKVLGLAPRRVMFPGKDGVQYLGDVIHTGRTRFDLLPVLKKHMITPPLKGYDLHTFVSHESLLKTAKTFSFGTFSYAQTTFEPIDEKMMLDLEMQLRCIKALESDNDFYVLISAIATSCYMPVYAAAERGQQARVKSIIFKYLHDEGIYCDDKMFDTQYVVVKMKRADSSFPHPPWLVNKPISSLVVGTIETPKPKKRKYTAVDLFGNRIKTKEELKKEKKAKTKRYSGGVVITPEPGFYRDPRHAVAVADFASLYPSVIVGYNICYMRVVYDRKWLDDPRATKQYLPLDEETCAVFVTHYDGEPVRTVFDVVIREIMKNRNRVRALMKGETDKFKLISLNGGQLSAKVLANGSYGYLGSSTSGMLCTALAASVTGIAAWQNLTSRHLALSLGGRVVYGDTDSVMLQWPTAKELTTRDEIMASIYQQSRAFAERVSHMFPPPNSLEFELVKQPFLLTTRKKSYIERGYSPCPEGWKKPGKIKFSGFAAKKRSSCQFVRDTGVQVVDQIIEEVGDQAMITYLTSRLHYLETEQLNIEDFTISCSVSAEYKNSDIIPVVVQKQIELATGTHPEVGRRVDYVCCLPEGAVCLPDKFKTSGLGLARVLYDRETNTRVLAREWYVANQLQKPILALLSWHPVVAKAFDREVILAIQRMRNKAHRIREVSSMFK